MKQLILLFVCLLAISSVFGQSANQEFPSPVLREDVAGAIAARDIGDSRLTRHFYAFYAGVGDLVLNLETANFNGDVDLFEAATLRPIAKITVYATDAANKTTRTIYFRRRVQVLMRVEGRTQNDEPANYRIGFSGSFAAATDLPQPPEDLEPKTSGKLSAGAVARVNSAGAIIEVLKPKEELKPVETQPENTQSESVKETSTTETAATAKRPPAARRTPGARTARSRTTVPPPQTEEAPKTESAENPSETVSTTPPSSPRTPRRSARRTARSQPAKTETNAEPKVDPLASVRLVVVLKDGYKIERPMSEILRASVDKGTLVVIAKDGKIERFSILDVLRFSIEQ